MDKNNPVIDQTLFDLKLNEAQFYSDQGLYDEADKIYLHLINELKRFPETRSSNIQIRQLESIRKEYQTEVKESKVVIKSSSDMDNLDEQSEPETETDMQGDLNHEPSLTKDFNNDNIDKDIDNQVAIFIDDMIIAACKRAATAIHIEPSIKSYDQSKDSFHAMIRFRVDGICQPYTEISNKLASGLIFRIKIMAKMDITMRGLPLDGKIRFKSEETGLIELRVVTVPTIGSKEDLVIKIFPGAKLMDLAELGFFDYTLDPFLQMVHKPSGLILVAGHLDSGKTTTIHSALRVINSAQKKIFSAENPVKIAHKGIRQAEVQPHKGLDYPILLKAFIKANPDVIMLGEMEDYETADLAIKSSLHGILLFAALNAESVSDTVRKVLEMGVNPVHFADSLLCILTQILVRRLCEECKKPSLHTLEMVIDQFGEDPLGLLENMDRDNIVLYDSDPDGCVHCGHTGYSGRIAVHELLINSDAVKLLIKDATCIEQLTESAAPSQSRFKKIDGAVKKLKTDAAGYRLYTFKQDGILKVMEGVTDMVEIGCRCL